MREIGGYLQLEQLAGNEYYSNLYRLNLGRTALLCLCQARHYTKLWMPRFLCDSVTFQCNKAGYALAYYDIDKDFSPVLTRPLAENEALYLVNYYGQLTDETIMYYKKQYGSIIVDHTHAFYQKPLPHVDTLYSCRKFFGVPDGAYLSMDTKLPLPLEEDTSRERMAHILGRFETDASSYYQTMLTNASSFHQEPIKQMSRLTQNLLGGIDYEAIRIQRNRNYAFLASALSKQNILHFRAPDGAFTYPFYYCDGLALRKRLSAKKIYVPTYWSNVITDMPTASIEHQYAANILPLPCDQRYRLEDMQYLTLELTNSIRDLENEK